MVLDIVAKQPPASGRGRRGPPLGLLGLGAALVALVAAYLSDCIPGLGSGTSPGTPAVQTPADDQPPPDPSTAPAASDASAGQRTVIVVQGEQCRRGDATPSACAEVCAGLGPHAAGKTVETVEIDATHGSHGAVESFRTCLSDAGYNVSIRWE